MIEKLQRYLKSGGALIASHRSLFDPQKGDFALPELGVNYLGESRYRDEYFYPVTGAFSDLPDYTYFLYQRGLSVEAQRGTQCAKYASSPTSTARRTTTVLTCRRRSTNGRREPFVVINGVTNGRTAYIANPFFSSYAADGYGVYKQMVAALIQRLLPEPVLRARNLPSTAQATVMEQRVEGGGKRLVVHVLYYPLTRRAPNLDIIEEAGLLKDVQLQLRVPAQPRRARLVPDGAGLRSIMRAAMRN